MLSNNNNLMSIPENFSILVDTASSLAPATPENAQCDDFCEMLNRIVCDEQGLADDNLHSLASSLIENSSASPCILPSNIEDFFELSDEDSKNIVFGTNVAKNMVEVSLQNEAFMILNGCHHIFRKEKITVHDLFGYFFGDNTLIVKHRKDQLFVDYEIILKLFHTISVIQAYCLSSSQLFDKNCLIDKEVIKVSYCT